MQGCWKRLLSDSTAANQTRGNEKEGAARWCQDAPEREVS